MSKAFNVGRDVSLTFVDPVQGVIAFAIKTGWSATAQYDQLDSKGLDSNPKFDAIPHGWRLTLDMDRANGNCDRYFAERERAYFAGEDVPLVSISETIRETNGGVSVYRFSDVSITMDESTFRGNQITTQRVTGMAARRIRVA